MYLVNIFIKVLFIVNGRGQQTTPIMSLARGNGHLAAIAGQYNALAGGKAGVALFLHYHDGAAIIFADL